MKRTLIVALVALAVPAVAAAKGPSKAEISGPGLGKPLVVTGAEAPGTPLMTLAESTGFFPAVYGQSPDPMLDSRPKGTLGPKYSVEKISCFGLSETRIVGWTKKPSSSSAVPPVRTSTEASLLTCSNSSACLVNARRSITAPPKCERSVTSP